MKKQGRVWSKSGAITMSNIITAYRNDILEQAMLTYGKELKSYANSTGLKYRYAVRNALKKLIPSLLE